MKREGNGSKTSLVFCILAISLLCCVAFASGKPTMHDVASKLACFCNTCPHLTVTDCTCSLADRIRTDITKRLNQGQTEDQIIQSYVAQYGQTVLAAPPKSGFNLTPWLIPFLAFGIGGAVLVTFLIKQRRPPKGPSDKSDAPIDPTDSYYREMLEKELQQRK